MSIEMMNVYYACSPADGVRYGRTFSAMGSGSQPVQVTFLGCVRVSAQ